MIGIHDKEIVEKIKKSKDEFEKAARSADRPDYLLKQTVQFLTALIALNKETPPKKKTANMELSDFLLIGGDLKIMIRSDVMKQVKEDLLIDFFTFTIAFGKEDSNDNLYTMFEEIIFQLLDFILTMKPPKFRIFQILKGQTSSEKFGLSLFKTMINLPKEKFDFAFDSFSTSFDDLTGKNSLLIWYKWFTTICVKELSHLNDQSKFNISQILIHFLLVPFQTLQEPGISPIRTIWANLSNDLKENIEKQFEINSTKTQNVFFVIVYLTFLMDSGCTNKDSYAKALSTSQGHHDMAKRYSIYLACLYFFEVIGLEKEKLLEFAQPAHLLNVSKSLSKQSLKFLENCSDLINSPWQFSQGFLEIPEMDYVTDSRVMFLCLDNNAVKKPFSKELILSICNSSIPELSCYFIKCIISIAKVCPQVFLLYPKSKLCELFLQPLLVIPKPSPLINHTLLELFSDFSLRWKLPLNVYAYWISSVIVRSFGVDEEKKFALEALAEIVRTMIPGCEVCYPVFLYLLWQKQSGSPLVPIYANAFASCRLIDNAPDKTRSLQVLKENNINTADYEKFDVSAAMADITKLYHIANKEQKNDVFSSAVQASIEDSLRGKDISRFQSFFVSIVPEMNAEQIHCLLAFQEADECCSPIILSVVETLIKFASPLTVEGAVRLMVSCPNVDFKPLHLTICEVLSRKGNENAQNLFIEEYCRYPYKNGINFFESHFNLLDSSSSPFILSDGSSTIVTGHVNSEASKLALSTKTHSGTSTYKSYIIQQDLTPRDKEETQIKTIKPQYDDSVQWGDISGLRPILFSDVVKATNPPIQRRATILASEAPQLDTVKQEKLYPIADGLLQLGILVPNDSPYRVIGNDAASIRECKALYQMPTRFTHKIALIYIGENQRIQDQLLANRSEDASSDFYNFIDHMGWPVDLTNHPSFSGGLDTVGFSTGKMSLYWADSANEVMWHVSPLIETQTTDSKNIYKKRHIGNDMVHVLWSEDTEEYDTKTITSQFNHAHVVIYPIGGKRYAVHVFKKEGIKWFGCLSGKTIVSEEALAALVRFTAVEADGIAREFTAGSKISPIEMIEKSKKQVWEMRKEQNPFHFSLIIE